MAEYKAIHGTTVSNRTSDPVTSGIVAGSWSSGGDLNEGREATGTAGISNSSAMIFGGQNPGSNPVNAEVYNGTAWTEVNNLTTIRWNPAGFGTVTASIATGGENPDGNLATTNSWNGTSWTEVADLNQARAYAAGMGTATAGIAVAGYTDTRVNTVEAWNGTAWTEIAEVNTARNSHGRAGLTDTDGLIFGGQTSPGAPNYTNATESWNGTAWTELNNLNAARGQLNTGSGTGASDALASGGILVPGTRVASTEFFNGTSWTEINNLSVARTQIGAAGTASSSMAAGGNTGSGTPTATEEWDAKTGSDASILNDGQVFYRSDTGDMKLSLTQYGTGAWATGGNMPSGRNARPTGAGTQTASVVFGGNPAGNVTLTYNGTAFATPGNNLNDGRYNSAGLGTSTAAFNVSGVPTTNPAPESVAVESWNGTSWTEIAEVNTGRDSLSAAANSTTSAALVFGGNNPSVTGITELWNGSAWSEVADMNTARKKSGGFGTSTSAIVAGGYISTNSNAVESWDGTSWTEVAECTAKDNCGASGVSGVLGQIFGGSPFVAVTQQWDGSSWTEVADLATARDQLGGTGNSTVTALAFGGRTPGGAVANTEEWTVPESISNLTITD